MNGQLIKQCLEHAISLNDDERLLLGVMMDMASRLHVDPKTLMFPSVNPEDFETVQDLLTIIKTVSQFSEEEYQKKMVQSYSCLRGISFSTLDKLLASSGLAEMAKLLPALSTEEYLLVGRIFCGYTFDCYMELREEDSSEHPYIKTRKWFQTLVDLAKEFRRNAALVSLLQSLVPLVHT